MLKPSGQKTSPLLKTRISVDFKEKEIFRSYPWKYSKKYLLIKC